MTSVTVIFIESAGFWVVMYQSRVKFITSVCGSTVATIVWLGTQFIICSWSEIEIQVFKEYIKTLTLFDQTNVLVAHVSAIIQQYTIWHGLYCETQFYYCLFNKMKNKTVPKI